MVLHHFALRAPLATHTCAIFPPSALISTRAGVCKVICRSVLIDSSDSARSAGNMQPVTCNAPEMYSIVPRSRNVSTVADGSENGADGEIGDYSFCRNGVAGSNSVGRRRTLISSLVSFMAMTSPFPILSLSPQPSSHELALERESWLHSMGGVAAALETTSAVSDYELVRFFKPDGVERNTDPYSFLVPSKWRQEPVSLNDSKLYGLDSRFVGADGSIDVLVLPIGNADKYSIEEVGDTDDVIGRFGPPDQPSRVESASVHDVDGTIYYYYELVNPRATMSAYVSASQVYVLEARGNPKRGKKAMEMLAIVRDSFRNERVLPIV